MKPIPRDPRLNTTTSADIYEELRELRIAVNQLIEIVNSQEERIKELESPEVP